MGRAVTALAVVGLAMFMAPWSAMAQDIAPADAPADAAMSDEEDVAPLPTFAPEVTESNTFEQKICPPKGARAVDKPDDAGGVIWVEFQPCATDSDAAPEVYQIYRAEMGVDGPSTFLLVGEIPAGVAPVEAVNPATRKPERILRWEDTTVSDAIAYLYRVGSKKGGEFAYSYMYAAGKPVADLGPMRSVRQTVTVADRDVVRGDLTVPAPGNVKAVDAPNDKGNAIIVTWDDVPELAQDPTLSYAIFRADKADAPFSWLGTVGPGKTEYMDSTLADKTGQEFVYLVAVANPDRTSLAYGQPTEPVAAKTQYFNTDSLNFIFFAVVLSFFIIFFIERLKRGKKLFVRKLAGLEAVEEAIGRATEMGKPVLYVPGILDMDDVQTVASMNILGRIAKSVAEYDTTLMVPTSKSLVMTTGRETVKEAFLSAGRPDAYNDDIVTYLTDEQFGYVAGVNGIMVRDKPATCIYFGAFFAESLILAETGNSIGAIQIAGTAMPSQLPFFIAACDYTLIGEELFAASAYLSGDPMQLGSLKGQDIGKLLAMLGIVFGSLSATFAAIAGGGFFQTVTSAFQAFFKAAAG
ncbi:MAG: hypothetical protein H6683_01495 [Deltaproteobacteria bacterium]|nr:hypothetical protein [Deltaproteobacteria bacterium]